jgi:hypothetical protein
VEIQHYDGVIDAKKLNGCFKQLEVYLFVHQVKEEHEISFACLSMPNHALI